MITTNMLRATIEQIGLLEGPLKTNITAENIQDLKYGMRDVINYMIGDGFNDRRLQEKQRTLRAYLMDLDKEVLNHIMAFYYVEKNALVKGENIKEFLHLLEKDGENEAKEYLQSYLDNLEELKGENKEILVYRIMEKRNIAQDSMKAFNVLNRLGIIKGVEVSQE